MWFHLIGENVRPGWPHISFIWGLGTISTSRWDRLTEEQNLEQSIDTTLHYRYQNCHQVDRFISILTLATKAVGRFGKFWCNCAAQSHNPTLTSKNSASSCAKLWSSFTLPHFLFLSPMRSTQNRKAQSSGLFSRLIAVNLGDAVCIPL